MTQPILEQSQPRIAQSKIVRRGEGESIDVFSERGRFILVSENTNGNLLLSESETPGGCGPMLHVHRCEDEVFLIQSGLFEWEIDGERTETGPGDLVYAPRDVPHTFRVVSDEPGRFFNIVFPGGFERSFRLLAHEFATGAPDFHRVARISEEFGVTYLAPETVTTQRKRRASDAPQPKVVPAGEAESLELMGNRIRFLLCAEDTAGQIGIVELTTPAGSGPALHCHSAEDEIFIVQSGRYEFFIGETTVEAGPGDVIYGAHPAPHGFRVVSEEAGTMTVLFQPAGFENFFRDLGAEYLANGLTPQRLAEIGVQHGLSYPT